MASIYTKYIEFLDFVDPFETADRDSIHSDMPISDILYNLIEMRKDWNWNIESAEYKKATELIDLIRSNECRK